MLTLHIFLPRRFSFVVSHAKGITAFSKNRALSNRTINKIEMAAIRGLLHPASLSNRMANPDAANERDGLEK